MKEQKRVAVAGAGAVGLMAALALSRRGFEVVVFEAKGALEPTPRADTLHPATLTLFERLGIVADVLSIGLRASRFQFRELADGVVAEFDLSALADVTAYPFRLHCAQDQLTRVLFEHVRAAKVGIEFNSRVVGVVEGERGVHVQIKRGEQVEGLEFDYLVAADGASSTVRTVAGIVVMEKFRATRMVQVMTTYDLSKAWPDLAPDAYFMDPSSPCVITQVPGAWRVLLALPERITDRDLQRDKWHRDTLAKLFALDRPISIFHETAYAIRTGIADSYRAGSVFLVGDAAHVVLPFAAMGLNCGIGDAYFLAKALYEQEFQGQDVLDSWATTRKAVALNRTIAESTALFAELHASGAERDRRNARLREIAGDPAEAHAYLLRSAMLDPESLRATAPE